MAERWGVLQCIGSRDLTCGAKYCSSVCCMYATKEAIVAKEHAADLDCTIFYIDIRAQGKDFEEFVERAKNDYGIKYKKAAPVRVLEPPGGEKGLILRYEDEETGEFLEEKFDLIVLSAGLLPREESGKLAETLGIELNPHGFSQISVLDKVMTKDPFSESIWFQAGEKAARKLFER